MVTVEGVASAARLGRITGTDTAIEPPCSHGFRLTSRERPELCASGTTHHPLGDAERYHVGDPGM